MIKTNLEIINEPIFHHPDPEGIIDVMNEDEYLEPLDSKRSLMQGKSSDDYEIEMWSNKIRQRSDSKKRTFQKAEDLQEFD